MVFTELVNGKNEYQYSCADAFGEVHIFTDHPLNADTLDNIVLYVIHTGLSEESVKKDGKELFRYTVNRKKTWGDDEWDKHFLSNQKQSILITIKLFIKKVWKSIVRK
jgi:hypothetical protein